MIARRLAINQAMRAMCAVIAGCATGLTWGIPAAAQDTDLANAIKAAYLYKFAPFVAWPPTLFRSASSPFTICVIGRDPFAGLLDRLTSGQTVYGHPIVVRQFATAGRDMDCQIMYLAGSDAQSVSDALAAVRGTPVLTVTDDARDPASRGIINFVIQDDRVRFAINQAAAAANGLSISSKLLSLAVDVTPRGTPR